MLVVGLLCGASLFDCNRVLHKVSTAAVGAEAFTLGGGSCQIEGLHSGLVFITIPIM